LFTISTSASDSFLALIFGLVVSDPTPNLSLSLSHICLSCARCLVLPGVPGPHPISLSLSHICLSLSFTSVSRALAAWFFRGCRAHTQSLSLSQISLSCARCLVLPRLPGRARSELRKLYETLIEKTWRDPIPSSQGCLQFFSRLDLWTRRLQSHTQFLSLSHQISLLCARCLVSESDCPGRFNRRIKTQNCRITHKRTDRCTTWIYR
jgi:hypothetical protein